MVMNIGDLNRAIRIAVEAHAFQFDKVGEPYILHPLAVMGAMQTYEERIVAVLHDVVEDTDVTIDDIQDHGFSDDILRAVYAISKLPNETNRAYLARVKANPLATKVKLADIAHNAGRLDKLPRADEREYLTKKYREATAYLTDAADEGGGG